MDEPPNTFILMAESNSNVVARGSKNTYNKGERVLNFFLNNRQIYYYSIIISELILSRPKGYLRQLIRQYEVSRRLHNLHGTLYFQSY